MKGTKASLCPHCKHSVTNHPHLTNSELREMSRTPNLERTNDFAQEWSVLAGTETPPKVSEKQLNYNNSYVQLAETTIAVDAFIWLKPMKASI